MRTVRQLLVAPLVLLIAAAGSAYADQQHIVDPAQVASTVAQKVAAQDADRAAVKDALARPEVQNIAASMGLDPARMSNAVDAMNAAELQRAASAARQVNEQLVGGASTVVISTTTIIVALLVVILLIVALK